MHWAEDLMSFNEIGVIPNYIGMESYTAPKAKRVNGNFVIGWHGTSSRLHTLKESSALAAVLSVLNDNDLRELSESLSKIRHILPKMI